MFHFVTLYTLVRLVIAKHIFKEHQKHGIFFLFLLIKPLPIINIDWQTLIRRTAKSDVAALQITQPLEYFY